MVTITGIFLFDLHLLQHLEEQKVGNLGYIGNRVSYIVIPHNLTQGFKRGLYLRVVQFNPFLSREEHIKFVDYFKEPLFPEELFHARQPPPK